MSQRTGPALAKLDDLAAALDRMPRASQSDRLLDDILALRRAVAAFHMEGIRFRMFSVDRDLKASGDAPELRRQYEELRQALEEAGFHTRSHTAP
jgi:hypothetical protein